MVCRCSARESASANQALDEVNYRKRERQIQHATYNFLRWHGQFCCLQQFAFAEYQLRAVVCETAIAEGQMDQSFPMALHEIFDEGFAERDLL